LWEAEVICPRCGYKYWITTTKKPDFNIDTCPMCGQRIELNWKKPKE
jgi:transcription elongation factor Elf1